MLALFATTLLVLAPGFTASKLEWLPDEFPNPLQHPQMCGHKTNDPAYICDPNRIIGENIHLINWILKDVIVNSTDCPCSNYFCEMRRGQGATGYKIGVALVRRMKIQTRADGRHNTLEDQAHLFAHQLENKWDMGSCDEDIIIFYSMEDKMLVIYGGSTALMKLTPYYRTLLSYKVGTRFNDGRIVEALNNLLHDMKLVLNCDGSTDCGVHEIRNGVSRTEFSSLLALSLVAISFHSMFSWI